MKKAPIAALLIVLCGAGCKEHTNTANKAKPVPIAIHEVVNCSAVQAVPVINLRSREKLCVAREAIVTEKNIRYAQAGDSSTDEPEVMLYLDRGGGARMYEATERISARRDNGRMAILIDGHLLSAPVVRGAIKDSMVINGRFTKLEAQDLADALLAGK
jgi:preprotein translocase subunit SecD